MTGAKRAGMQRILVLGCLLLAFLFGTLNLKNDPMAPAEYNTVKRIFSSSSYDTVVSLYNTIRNVIERSEQHGPLHFGLLNIWSGLTGSDLATMRLLSVYFGLLMVAVVYRLAMLTRDDSLALAAVFIVIFTSFFIFYIHELRVYSMLSFFAGWVIWAYWQVLNSPTRWKWLLLFAGTALILYVHYFGIMVLAAIGVYHLLFVPKNRHWLRISLVVIAGGLMFLPWLPVMIDGLITRRDLANSRLNTLEAIGLLLSIYSNRLWFIPLAAAVMLLRRIKHLAQPHKYLLFLMGATLVITLLINELTPILVERRMRYTTVFIPLFACSFAIAWSFFPKHKLIQIPLLFAWLAAFFLFNTSQDLLVYTNRYVQKQDAFPHYQHFYYSSASQHGYDEMILSLHPTAEVQRGPFNYYSHFLSDWTGLVHITYGEQGELVIRASRGALGDLDGIAAESDAIWLLYNPQQTAPDKMDVYQEWLLQHYQFCRRFFEKDDTIIDHYSRISIPCE